MWSSDAQRVLMHWGRPRSGSFSLVFLPFSAGKQDDRPWSSDEVCQGGLSILKPPLAVIALPSNRLAQLSVNWCRCLRRPLPIGSGSQTTRIRIPANIVQAQVPCVICDVTINLCKCICLFRTVLSEKIRLGIPYFHHFVFVFVHSGSIKGPSRLAIRELRCGILNFAAIVPSHTIFVRFWWIAPHLWEGIWMAKCPVPIVSSILV